MSNSRSAKTFFLPVFVFVLIIGASLFYYQLPQHAAALVVSLAGALYVIVELNRICFMEKNPFFQRLAYQTYLAGAVLCLWLGYGLMWTDESTVVPEPVQWATWATHTIVTLSYHWFRVDILDERRLASNVGRFAMLITTLALMLVPVNIAHTMEVWHAIAQICIFFAIWYVEMILGELSGEGVITNEYLTVVGLGVLRIHGLIAVTIAAWFLTSRLMQFSQAFDGSSIRKVEKTAQMMEEGTLKANRAAGVPPAIPPRPTADRVAESSGAVNPEPAPLPVAAPTVRVDLVQAIPLPAEPVVDPEPGGSLVMDALRRPTKASPAPVAPVEEPPGNASNGKGKKVLIKKKRRKKKRAPPAMHSVVVHSSAPDLRARKPLGGTGMTTLGSGFGDLGSSL